MVACHQLTCLPKPEQFTKAATVWRIVEIQCPDQLPLNGHEGQEKLEEGRAPEDWTVDEVANWLLNLVGCEHCSRKQKV